MEPLKEIYSKTWILNLSEIVSKVDSKINSKEFQKKILESPWDNFELKERINRIADVFMMYWDLPISKLEPKLYSLIESLRHTGVNDFNFPYIFLNDIVTKSGLSDFETSMRVFEKTTVFSSAEFAIRYFYQTHFEKTLKQMIRWSKNKQAYVRRLSSEGSRPILPWGIGIPEIKKKPEIHLQILENLWDDENEIVRRSVANHLNDISKIQPDLVLQFCKTRFGRSEILDKNLKHALRGLLKKGNQTALSFFQFDSNWKPSQLQLKLKRKKLRIGENLEFHIHFVNPSKIKHKLRIEYKIDFLLSNGTYGSKIFQLGEKNIDPFEIVSLQKTHSFRPITTRKFYAGTHRIGICINGSEFIKVPFELMEG